MKKFKLFIITILLLTLICSCQKNQYTEISLDSGEVYQIYKTKDKEEVKKIFQTLKDATFNRPSFNGIEIKLNSKAEGNLSIENNEITNVEIKYDLTLDGKSNLKKFLFDGTINMEGYTKTRSPSLSIDAKQKIIGNLINDTTNLYLNGRYESNENKINIKKKLDITDFTEKYHAIIISICDILKYKKISEIVPEINDFVETYVVAITETKKTSFTAQYTFPIQQKNIDLFIEISSETLLPVNLSFHLDAILIEHLKKEYIEKYLTDAVNINKASFELNVKLSYGNYSITELSDAEKEEYTY